MVELSLTKGALQVPADDATSYLKRPASQPQTGGTISPRKRH
jgi:hypothetical protein